MFSNTIRLKKFVIKQLKDVFWYLFICQINIKLKKCATETIRHISRRHIPDQCKTQHEAVDDCLAALKFVSDGFVISKMLDNASHANDNMFFYNEDFNKVTFIACQRQILAADLDKIKLGNDDNFYENDPDTIIHFRLLAWCSNFKKRKAL